MKSMRRFLNKLRPFRIQIFLVLCLLAFFVMYLMSYNSTVERMKTTEIDRTLQYMLRGTQEVSAAFLSIYSQTGIWAGNQSIKNLARAENSLNSQNFADLISLTKTISETWQQSELAHMLLLVDNQDGLMISDKDTLHNFRFSYESGVYCVDDLSYEEFINAIRSSANTRLTPGWFMPAMTFSRYSYEDQLTSRSTVVSYVYSMPIRQRTNDIYAVISLDVNEMYDMVSGDSAVSDSFYIYYKDALLYGDATEKIDPTQQISSDHERGVTYISASIPGTNLYCVLKLEDQVVLNGVQNLTMMNNVVSIAFIATCILLVFLFAVTLMRPVYSLARGVGLDGEDVGPDIFAHIRDSIDGIRLDNQRMISTLSRWEPILHTQIIEHALRGIPLSDVEKELLNLVVGDRQAWRVALAGRICGSGLIPENIIAGVMEQVIICPMDGTRVALLVNADCNFPFEEKCQALLDALNLSETSQSFAVGVCPAMMDFSGLRMAFTQASAALDKALWWDNSAVIVYESSTSGLGYSISYETLNQLYDLVMSGCGDAAEILIRREMRMAERFYDVRGDELHRRMMYYDLLSLLMRVSEQVNIQSIMRGLQDAELQRGFEARVQMLLEGFRYASEIRSSSLNDQRQNLSERMKEYILANYSNPALSLSMAAAAFDVCDQTFSKLFKDETGVNFSVYLEKVRISASEELLHQGRSVSDTAALCGYASVNTFGKAFKRRCGVSPTEWIKAQTSAMKYSA